MEEMTPIILGEWWRNDDANQLLEDAVRTGRDVKPSDATNINGEPGDLFPCSKPGTVRVRVKRGKTYLLRVINAGLTNDMFFAVAGHRLTVVATDARYAKPFAADHLMVASGQTVDALLRADRAPGDGGRYYMAARTFASNTNVDFNNSTATAVVEYADAPPAARRGPPAFPATLPAVDDAAAAEAYTARLRSLASEAHPVDVPARADERMLVTMAVNLIPCVAPNAACSGPRGDREGEPQQRELPEPRRRRHPRRLLPRRLRPRRVRRGLPRRPPVPLQLHRPGDPGGGARRPVHGRGHQGEGAGARRRRGGGVPGHDGAGHGEPPHAPARVQLLRGGARARQLRRGQGPRRLQPGRPASAEHGGRAQGRLGGDPLPRKKPGVWFMHCHLDRHVVWGMDTVFIVKDGKAPEAKMMRPPPDMPKC
ncbi:hypothetical protein GQ55_4G011300 [Panicum hallii var. hallii]|uniref:laccase n=1 Tax=Panicum hallii var. hallii TaxID=1504633 RepID=A0A2T7DU06_9POAL|nr:hypothetical protein GQ55_4G011300 [Panicum hallii var. hallii]